MHRSFQATLHVLLCRFSGWSSPRVRSTHEIWGEICGCWAFASHLMPFVEGLFLEFHLGLGGSVFRFWSSSQIFTKFHGHGHGRGFGGAVLWNEVILIPWDALQWTFSPSHLASGTCSRTPTGRGWAARRSGCRVYVRCVLQETYVLCLLHMSTNITYIYIYYIRIYVYIMYILCIYYVYVTKKMSHEAKYLKQNHRSACMVWSQGWFSFMMLCSIWDQKGYIWVHVDQERVWGSTCGRTPPQQFYRLGKIAVPWWLWVSHLKGWKFGPSSQCAGCLRLLCTAPCGTISRNI